MRAIIHGPTPLIDRPSLTCSRPADLPREEQLLLACARTALTPADLDTISARVQAGVDWDRFVAIVETSGLAPLIYRHLSRHWRPLIPADALVRLRIHVHYFTRLALLL